MACFFRGKSWRSATSYARPSRRQQRIWLSFPQAAPLFFRFLQNVEIDAVLFSRPFAGVGWVPSLSLKPRGLFVLLPPFPGVWPTMAFMSVRVRKSLSLFFFFREVFRKHPPPASSSETYASFFEAFVYNGPDLSYLLVWPGEMCSFLCLQGQARAGGFLPPFFGLDAMHWRLGPFFFFEDQGPVSNRKARSCDLLFFLSFHLGQDHIFLQFLLSFFRIHGNQCRFPFIDTEVEKRWTLRGRWNLSYFNNCFC